MMQSDASEEISEPEEETEIRERNFSGTGWRAQPTGYRAIQAMKDTGVNFKKHPGLYYFFIRALFTL